jgi:exodeoxyribonuclease V alpha subunit
VSLDARSALRPYVDAGLLGGVDVHAAATLARLCGLDDADVDVALAVALAVRAPRIGDVCVDLHRARPSVVGDPDDDEVAALADLYWPEPERWVAQVAASPVLGGRHPALVLHGSRLYVERYAAYERAVAELAAARATRPVEPIAPAAEVLDVLLTGDEHQRAAVEAALRSGLTVLVGGPGTGKTTTVAALLASLLATTPDLRIALTAPTGKAAARLEEALRDAAARLPERHRARLAGVEAATIHRLLGVRRSLTGRFVHDRHRPLAHDVVIVDETSMVSLPLMASLLDALRPEARLVLVGDPDQLASVEAGAVLGDLAGPRDAGASGPLAGSVSVLHRSRRFPPTSPLGRLALAVRAGDDAAVLAVLRERPATAVDGAGGQVTWIDRAADEPDVVDRIRGDVLPAVLAACRYSTTGDGAAALATIESVRLLCAHRLGPFGVERWNRRVEGWIAAEGMRAAGWYPGRPVLVTANDYRNSLFNGDLGVTVRAAGSAQVVFASASGLRAIAPSRLESVETVHATTVHKSQGSEFDHVVVVLPPPHSPLATRELLYTAITRARLRVTLVGDEAAVLAAVGRRAVRASGLGDALWGAAAPG